MGDYCRWAGHRGAPINSRPVTEALVDAKDEARQAEVRTDIAQALLTIDRRINRSAWRTVGFTVATMFAIAGLLVVVVA